MKVRFLEGVSGAYTIDAKTIVDINDIPNGDGPRLLKAGICEPVQEEKRTATAKAPHKAVKE